MFLSRGEEKGLIVKDPYHDYNRDLLKPFFLGFVMFPDFEFQISLDTSIITRIDGGWQ